MCPEINYKFSFNFEDSRTISPGKPATTEPTLSNIRPTANVKGNMDDSVDLSTLITDIVLILRAHLCSQVKLYLIEVDLLE